MVVRMMSIALVSFGALGAVVFAQTSPSVPSSAGLSPSVQGRAGQTNTVNLNTAASKELRKLPRLSPGSVAAIIESRAKSSFKSWDDFVSRRIVPPYAEKEIKGLVTF